MSLTFRSPPLLMLPVVRTLLLAFLLGLVSRQPRAAAADAPAPAAPDAARFLTGRAVLWLGRTAAIPVNVPVPSTQEQLLCVTVDDPSVVEVLRAPVILPGEKLGFARVRALKAGRARLRTLDGQTLNVEVRRDPAAAVVAEADGARPRIVSPGAGAVVWGPLAVAVEVLDAPPAGSLARAPITRVQLRLPDGRRLEPMSDTAPDLGPVRRWTFRVDADSLPVGPARLIALATVDAGGEITTSESEPLTLHVVRRPAVLAAGPCAAPIGGSDGPNDLAPVRPARFGTRRPNVVNRDPGADSPKILQCASEDPAWCLPLVVPAAGRYQMMLRTRGDAAAGTLPTLGLYVNHNEAPLRVARLAEGAWHRLPVGAPFALEAGPNVVTVRFMNDFSVGKEDRNAWFDRFELVRVPDHVAPTTPVAAADVLAAKAPPRDPVPSLTAALADARPQVLYPANGALLWEADAVVARVSAPVAWADVVVDGQPLNVRLERPPADRPLVFPLPLRGFTGSNRHLSVRVADGRGNVTDAPFRFVHFLDGPPPVPGPYARALRLLDRLAYGPEPRELAALLTEGEAAWLDRRLFAPPNPAVDEANLARAALRYPQLADNNQAVYRALAQSLGDDNPVRARFTLWAENHFSTWVNKAGGALKWREHARFARAGLAPFPSLLDLSARSPAMLVYLDQEKSYAGKINENYAREIMELHTLSVRGGYSQADVTALAGVLNGWTLSDEARLPAPGEEGMQPGNNKEAGLEKGFRYDPVLNDGQPRRVFGLDLDAAPDRALRYDRVQAALEMLAAHPATAEHVCRKLVGHYLGAPADDGLVRDLSRVFLENGGDPRAVLRAMAAHPKFWELPPRLANPQDYGLRLARVLRGLLDLRLVADADVTPKPDALEGYFRKSGMGLFDRVTPDGYPETDAAYADSNAMLQRWRFAQGLGNDLARLVPPAWRQPFPSESASTLPAIDPGQRLLDLAAMRLTGRPLGAASNAAAREVLGDNPKPDAVTPAVVFVSLLPEANLR